MKVTQSSNGIVSMVYDIPDDSPKAKAIIAYVEDKKEFRKAAQEGRLNEYYERTGKKPVDTLQLLFGRKQ
jgi:hypothetical protein